MTLHKKRFNCMHCMKHSKHDMYPCTPGSGYLLAAMAKMVGPNGYVLGVEKYPELVQRSLASLRRSNPELFEAGRLAGAPAGLEAAGRQERGMRVVAANALSGA